MKRKLCIEELRDEKTEKMNQTNVEMKNFSEIAPSNERKFNFKLTDKRAKANLLKSASRQHFEVETKQKSKNLKFCAGAFIHVAKPMIEECESKYRSKTKFIYNQMVISVQEFREGFELNHKNFDTKIVFCVNRNKVVMHCYNSTQNVKVEGSGYLNFIENFLEPLFLSNLECSKMKIVDYDRSVMVALLGVRGRPIRARSVKKVRSVINYPHFLCKKCDSAFDSYILLKKHRVTEHTKSFNSSQNSIRSIKHSTRNNSFSDEMLMCDDVTLFSFSGQNDERIPLEEETEKITCEVREIECFATERLQTHILQREHEGEERM